MRAALCALAVVLALTADASSRVRAQQPDTTPAGVVSVGGLSTAAAMRDPFVRPAAPVIAAAPFPEPVARGEGLPGLSVEEVTVRGVLRAGDRSVALLQGPDQKHHVVRPGDRLRDGLVESVTADGLVIVMEPDDAAAAGGGPTLRRALRLRREER